MYYTTVGAKNLTLLLTRETNILILCTILIDRQMDKQ